jgi:hypothetical protein
MRAFSRQSSTFSSLPSAMSAFSRLMNPKIIFFISSIFKYNLEKLFSFKNCKSLERRSKHSTSQAEAYAILKNLANSLSLFRPQPSAMFALIEIEERLICEVNPNFSLSGNALD